jgi:hypothetical protein
MSIQVIGAGLGRTGTLSLKAALEELGFTKCYHMVEGFTRKDDAQIWDCALRGEPVDWDRLFAGYRATVDQPSCLFYREQLEKYPEAKVILTVRDPDRWYDSARQTIYFARTAFPRWAAVVNPRMLVFPRLLRCLIRERHDRNQRRNKHQHESLSHDTSQMRNSESRGIRPNHSGKETANSSKYNRTSDVKAK